MEKVTSENFKTFIENKPCIVMCTAAWCGPCKQIKPIFTDLVEKCNARAGIVDVDEESEVAIELQISAMPTFILFTEMGGIFKSIGANPQELKQLMLRQWKMDP